MSDVFENLIGKVVRQIRIESGESYIQVDTDDGDKFYYHCYGDCCANAYVEHISGIDALLGQEVISVDSYDAGSKNDGEFGVSDYTRYTICTAQGSFEIELRVDHNGYYGGYIERSSRPNNNLRHNIAVSDF